MILAHEVTYAIAERFAAMGRQDAQMDVYRPPVADGSVACLFYIAAWRDEKGW